MKIKLIGAVLSAVLLAGAPAILASASFGSGVAVIADDVSLVKSGIAGEKLTFTDSDFKAALGITDFKSITLTSLPESGTGTLLYAGRRATEGQTVKRRNVPSLVFLPASADVTEARFGFTVSGYSDAEEIECVMRFTGTVNKAPRAASSSSDAVTVQAGVGIGGKMTASDPEGDKIDFIIVRYPSHGTLEVGADGEYFYTPVSDYKGKDEFCYTARDEWGNWSEVVNVELTVEKRVSDTVFSDMRGRSEYAAALVAEAKGIMTGISEGERTFFFPDESITRAEFVAAAMKAAGMTGKDAASYFDDDADIPDEYRSYVAKAASSGVINGRFEEGALVFAPNEKITKYEAAKIIADIAGLRSDDETVMYTVPTDVPVWARDAVGVMYTLGLIDPEKSDSAESLTRGEAAVFLVKLGEIL